MGGQISCQGEEDRGLTVFCGRRQMKMAQVLLRGAFYPVVDPDVQAEAIQWDAVVPSAIISIRGALSVQNGVRCLVPFELGEAA